MSTLGRCWHSRRRLPTVFFREALPSTEYGKHPALWRLAGQIAEGRSQTTERHKYLEKALHLEYQDLPDIIKPTNAQILWDRAQNLRQAGKTVAARQLFQRIAEGQWQPRFQGLVSQARQQLGS